MTFMIYKIVVTANKILQRIISFRANRVARTHPLKSKYERQKASVQSQLTLLIM